MWEVLGCDDAMWKEDRRKVFVLHLKREALWLILATGPLRHELHKKPMTQYDAHEGPVFLPDVLQDIAVSPVKLKW